MSSLLIAGLACAQEPEQLDRKHADQLQHVSAAAVVDHSDCTYFGSQREKMMPVATGTRSRLTSQVVGRIPAESSGTKHASTVVPIGGNSSNSGQVAQMATIDKYIFQALAQAGVDPAPATTDAEFIRRVTLDLTGRIPTPARFNQFINDTTPTKRAAYIDELLASPQWVDKWTMYFGDLYLNARRTTQTTLYEEGRNAFYQWIKTNLTNNAHYNQMAYALIATVSADRTTLAQGSFGQGELNWLMGGYVQGGGIPQQDTFDQQAANVANTFLGISHQNCLLCHNGAGHLTTLSLWGGQQTRYQGWQFAAFMSRTIMQQNSYQRASGGNPISWWTATNNRPVDYQVNTTTGNRPARAASATPSGKDSTIAPQYNYSTPPQKPNPGEDYRAALGRLVTNDPQFARATVNYIWAEMFNMGIVDPPDQFDPARLDPYNLPPAPWTLQPSNPMLLNALAADFIASGYDLKALLREIANSRTYQLSSRYNGTWNDAWEPLFARKLVRRLTAEEIHDAVVLSSNVPSPLAFNEAGIPVGPGGIGDTTPFQFAMQLPDTDGSGNGEVTFLDDFLRGNRIDIFRSGDSSALQALDLMNSTFVMNRVRASGTSTTGSLLQQNIGLADNQLVTNLFQAVLSRNPTTAELNTAVAALESKGASGRPAEAVNLLWTLYNKVDFIFNY